MSTLDALLDAFVNVYNSSRITQYKMYSVQTASEGHLTQALHLCSFCRWVRAGNLEDTDSGSCPLCSGTRAGRASWAGTRLRLPRERREKGRWALISSDYHQKLWLKRKPTNTGTVFVSVAYRTALPGDARCSWRPGQDWSPQRGHQLRAEPRPDSGAIAEDGSPF